MQVILRCRPFNDEEIRQEISQVVTCSEVRKEVVVSHSNAAVGKIERTFTFDKVFGPLSQQEDVFHQALVPIVDEVMEGFNCTIFAYGQTGTGKTYTMEGKGTRTEDGFLHPQAGVIPRAVEQIFSSLESQRIEYTVKVTFLELYNEELTDLLAPEQIVEDKQKKPLALMDDTKTGCTLVRGLEEEIVTTASEIFSLLERGSAKRKTAETMLNKQSSRSHSIFTITIHMREPTPDGQELIKCGKLNLVDLAGSENIVKSGARDGRAREAGEINKSLLTLGRVITALVDHSGHIPYRDSKLTRLLRDSLGGRTKTCIIATVSPSSLSMDETLNTLDYAYRAKSIKNKPEVNQKTTKSALIKDLVNELERCKSDLFNQREKNGVYIPYEKHQKDMIEQKALKDRHEFLEEELDTAKKQIEESRNKIAIMHSKYEDLELKLSQTQANLEEKQNKLAATEDHLRRANQDIKEKDYVIECQLEAEYNLADLGEKTREELSGAANHIEALSQKLEREEVVKACNAEAGGQMRVSVQDQLHQLQNYVVTAVTSQQDHHGATSQHLQALLERKIHDMSAIKSQLSELQEKFTKGVDEATSLVDERFSQLIVSWEGLSLDETKFMDSLKKGFTTIVQQAETNLSELEKSLKDQRDGLATFAQTQQEANKYVMAVSNQITAAMEAAFKKISAEAAQCDCSLSENSAAHSKTWGEMESLLEKENNEGEQAVLEFVKMQYAKSRKDMKELVIRERTKLMEETEGRTRNIHNSLSSVKSTVTEAGEQMAEFNSGTNHWSHNFQNKNVAQHCLLESHLQASLTETQNVGGQWRNAEGIIGKSFEAHKENIENLTSQQVLASGEFVKSQNLRGANFKGQIDGNHVNINSLITASQQSDTVGIKKARAALSESNVAMENFQSSHGNHAKRVFDRIECYLLKDLKVDDGSPPAKRAIHVPPENSFAELLSKPVEKLTEEFNSNTVDNENIFSFARKNRQLALPQPLADRNRCSLEPWVSGHNM